MIKSSSIPVLFLHVLALHQSMIGMESPRLRITTELIIEYKPTFPDYLKSKESERSQLCALTDSGRWYGKLMTSVIEYSSPLMRLGNVKVDEAKKFLNRVFHDNNKHLLDQAIEELEQSEHNMAYIQALFDELDIDALKTKDRARIIKLMCTKKHARVPNAELLVLVNELGQYYIADNDFFPYAVSNMFAFHILESDLTIKKLGL